MSIETIKNAITSRAARQVLLTQKHSPKILFVAGTVGVVTAGVLACRATLKLDEVLTEHEKDTSRIDFVKDGDDERQKLKVQLTVKTAMSIIKLYAPSIIIGATSIAALTGSHVILTKRNGAAMAAYAALDRAYREYRSRVVAEYGKDTDKKFAAEGLAWEDVEEKTAEGTIKVTKKGTGDGKNGSPYVFQFDEFAKKFSREPGRNAMTIQMVQQYANDKLRANGHLFMNEVLDMLGMPRTKAGAVVGWVYLSDSEREKRIANGEPVGDNYVDFGVFDGDAEWVESFIDGREGCVKLNFNVDGMILDLI